MEPLSSASTWSRIPEYACRYRHRLAGPIRPYARDLTRSERLRDDTWRRQRWTPAALTVVKAPAAPGRASRRHRESRDSPPGLIDRVDNLPARIADRDKAQLGFHDNRSKLRERLLPADPTGTVARDDARRATLDPVAVGQLLAHLTDGFGCERGTSHHFAEFQRLDADNADRWWRRPLRGDRRPRHRHRGAQGENVAVHVGLRLSASASRPT